MQMSSVLPIEMIIIALATHTFSFTSLIVGRSSGAFKSFPLERGAMEVDSWLGIGLLVQLLWICMPWLFLGVVVAASG